MSIRLEQYLALSSVSCDRSIVEKEIVTIRRLIDSNKINNYFSKNGVVAPEFRALSELADWRVVNMRYADSGMFAYAVQNPDTKEMVFVYGGTNVIERTLVEAIKDYETDLAIASSGNVMLKNGLNQFRGGLALHQQTA